MDLFLREAAVRLEDDDVLSRIDALLDWRAFSPILQRGLGRSGSGPQGYDPLVLFKRLLIGQWHGLSDPKLERALKVRLDFMLFCGFGLHAPAPDETIHCRFRNALVKGGVYDDLPGEVCRQLEDHGLKLKAAEAVIIAAEAAIIDATSAARPRSHIDPPQDRAEGDAPDDPDLYFSADPDARWIRKGLKSTLGYFFQRLPPCLIGIEACAGAHYRARELAKFGHEVRLMQPSYVKGYAKRGKTDAADAAAICEAVSRPSTRFVPVIECGHPGPVDDPQGAGTSDAPADANRQRHARSSR